MPQPRRFDVSDESLETFFPQLDEILSQFSETTALSYRRALKRFVLYAKPKRVKGIRQISEKVVADYVESVRPTQAPSSLQGVIVGLRRILEWYIDQGIIPYNPVTKRFSISRKGRDETATVFPHDFIEEIFAAIPNTPRGLRDRACLMTIYYTMSRYARIRGLRVSNYSGTHIVLADKTKMPVHPELRKALDAYLKHFRSTLRPSDHLFQSVSKTQKIQNEEYDQKSMRAALHKYTEAAGYPNQEFTLEMMRDSAIASFLNNGGEIRTLVSMLNAESLRFLERFIEMRNQVQPEPEHVLLIGA